MNRRSGPFFGALPVLCVVPAACTGNGGPASGGTPTPSAASTTPSAAPSPSPTPETLSERSVVRLDRIGPVRVGMTPAEGSAAAGVTLAEGVGAGTDECHYTARGRSRARSRGSPS